MNVERTVRCASIPSAWLITAARDHLERSGFVEVTGDGWMIWNLAAKVGANVQRISRGRYLLRSTARKGVVSMDEDRKAFEAFISAPPFERSVGRYGATSAWAGTYRDRAVDLAWHAWQAAIAYERERAAKVCESLKSGKLNHEDDDVAAQDQAFRIAAAEIRKGSRFGGLSND